MSTSKDYLPNSDAIYDRVIAALETVRPYLQVDGGDCQLVGISKDFVVDVKLLGACGSCPMSTLTLRAGVEQAIKKANPEIVRVESVLLPQPSRFFNNSSRESSSLMRTSLGLLPSASPTIPLNSSWSITLPARLNPRRRRLCSIETLAC